MSKWKLEQWCVYAAHGVRYLPDRKQVYKELRQHVDDRYESFTARGEGEEEAVAHTLDAMGDAGEVSAMLALVHPPFWGYLYSTVKWIVILMACVCLLYLPYYLNHTHYYKFDRPKVEDWTDGYIVGVEPVMYAEPGTSVTCDGYTVTLTNAALWRTPLKDSQDHDTLEYLAFQLEVTNPRPWAQTPDVMKWISAEDSNGNYHYAYKEAFYIGLRDECFFGNSYRVDLFTTLYRMHMCWHLPEGTEWVDLHYNRDGRDWTIRIDLTGGNDA